MDTVIMIIVSYKMSHFPPSNKQMDTIDVVINCHVGCVIVERSKAPNTFHNAPVCRGFESRCRKYGGKFEVELRHIEVVNGWYTVRVLLHVT